MQTRLKSSASFVHQANWQELYESSNHWPSDLGFLRDELKFLSRLVTTYFSPLIEDHRSELLQNISARLLKKAAECEELINLAQTHNQRLILLAEEQDESPERIQSPQMREEHKKLAQELAEFQFSVAALKKEIFDLTEGLMQSDKLQKLLGA